MRPRRRWGNVVALAPALLMLGVLFGGALAGALRVSLVPLGSGLGGASLDAWTGLFADEAFWDGLWFTLRIALMSTILAAVAGVLMALVLRRSGTVARTFASIPIPVPHLLAAVIAVVWLAPGGVAERILGGLPVNLVRDKEGVGIVLVYVYKEAPFIALLALSAMGRSLREREEAAAVMGVSGWQGFAWVVWPAIRRPVLAGAAVVTAFAIGAFEVPLTVGPNYPQTISAFAFEETQGNLFAGQATAAAALLVAGLLAIAVAALVGRIASAGEHADA